MPIVLMDRPLQALHVQVLGSLHIDSLKTGTYHTIKMQHACSSWAVVDDEELIESQPGEELSLMMQVLLHVVLSKFKARFYSIENMLL